MSSLFERHIKHPPLAGRNSCLYNLDCEQAMGRLLDRNSTILTFTLRNNYSMLVHNVYFTLNDPSEKNIAGMVAACQKYLKNHPGVVFFGAGTVVDDLARPVNDRMFHVALHVVFDGKPAHDAYQVHPDHLKFIEEHKPGWRQVRVFDSYAS